MMGELEGTPQETACVLGMAVVQHGLRGVQRQVRVIGRRSKQRLIQLQGGIGFAGPGMYLRTPDGESPLQGARIKAASSFQPGQRLLRVFDPERLADQRGDQRTKVESGK